jgi:type I restriction enzyme S subunit
MPGDFPYYGANGQVGTVGDYLFDGEYILLAEDGGYFDQPERGVAYQVSGQFWVNNHAHILSTMGDVPPTYIRRVLNHVDWMKFVSGTTRLKLTQAGMQRVEIPVPPLREQHRIVAKLDALTARLARARAELDRVPVLARKLRDDVLSQALSGKLAGVSRVEHRPCSDWVDSTFYGPRVAKEDYLEVGIPTARTTDFHADGTMSLNEAPRVACSETDYVRWGLADGDLLVTRTGSIGKCAVYAADYGRVLPSAYLIRVRFNQTIRPRFAWMMFASPEGQAYLGVNSRAVTQPNINASAIRSLPFPVLTLDQQQATVAAVDSAFARADRLEAEAARARALLDRLEAAILARAFRGELVPQDPNDEPASALLARIRAQREAAPKAGRGRKAKKAADA